MAQRALKKVEPLLIFYGNQYPPRGMEDRQDKLENYYYFRCNCIACKQKWPTISELVQREPIFSCPACSKCFHENNVGSSQFRKCVLTAPTWKCNLCATRYKEHELQRRLRVNKDVVKLVLQRCYRPREAYEMILRVCEYFRFSICPPDVHLYTLQDVLHRCVLLILHFTP